VAPPKAVKALKFTTPIEHRDETDEGGRPKWFGVLIEDVTEFKKSRFCASLSHHKGNKERLVQ
jgi:hypothetical protein